MRSLGTSPPLAVAAACGGRWRQICASLVLLIPGVVQLLHTDETADAVLLFFRAAAGGDMYRSLKLQPWDEARLRDQVVVPLLAVLARLHSMGYVHRDIKPENIFFAADGSLELGDFGLTIDQRRERPISRVGTTVAAISCP
ncbi:aurora kinase, other [Monoraphidium neglectum]|uniref:Aurora kinase, other n=1 Tax=Monoraphidium neglectum TaxID=145388 RepID=A0A0D2MAB9_9CHLO|nr:aurora kinase, other [Monoraphidium neglectum]KIZ00220.1 aurora kinase, other [Monoraphidium neglectum]|eukprot:XP_013899239.1 aurora kinase, other [Monoraphidium neglectum]